jgi:Protein of unknown function (DUF3570)
MQLERQQPAARLIMAAALALPGIAPQKAMAEAAPEHGQIGIKYLKYQDSQSGLNRIGVSAPSVYGLFPIAGKWAIEGSITTDSVSGPSPRYYSAISSASRMHDFRKAFDAKLTRYWDRSTLSVGASYSTEHDYVSRALSVSGTVSTEDNNRTWAYGIGLASDLINPVNNIVVDASKKTTEIMFGVTQVLTPQDIGQVNVTYARGRGYFNDPYKFDDLRPDARNQFALMGRWNHYFSSFNATSRLSYRLYKDNYGVNGHTVSAEWVQTLKNGWTLTPLLRLHSQSAANFYVDPSANGLPPNWSASTYHSADQRLSAFGARTLGMKVAKAIGNGWVVDLRYDLYRQQGSYRLFGTGESLFDAAPFARFFCFYFPLSGHGERRQRDSCGRGKRRLGL